MRLQGSPVHDLMHGFALAERLERQLERKGAGRVLVGGENRRIKQEPVIGGNLSGIKLEKAGRNHRRPDLELGVAHDQHAALLGLGVERAEAGEGERVALSVELAVERGEKSVGPENRRLQINFVTTIGLFPVANIPSGKLDVAVFGRRSHFQDGDGSPGNEVVDDGASVGNSFADREQVDRIGLDREGEPLDRYRGLPIVLAQPIGRLQTGDLPREIGAGDFRQAGHRALDQAKASLGGDADIPANRFYILRLEHRQNPRTGHRVEVLLQTQLNNLPARERIGEDHLQPGPGGVGIRRERIIAQLGDVDPGNGEIRWHAQIELAQWRFSNLQFDLRLNRRFGFTQMIEQQLGNGQFGQNVFCLHAQRIIAAGKAVSEGLAALRRGEFCQILALRK